MLKWYKVVNERAGHDDLMDLGGKVERALNDHDVEEKSKEERHETLGRVQRHDHANVNIIA